MQSCSEPRKYSPSAEFYRDSIKGLLEETGGHKLILTVFDRLVRKENDSTLEGDELMRLAVLREVAAEL